MTDYDLDRVVGLAWAATGGGATIVSGRDIHRKDRSGSTLRQIVAHLENGYNPPGRSLDAEARELYWRDLDDIKALGTPALPDPIDTDEIYRVLGALRRWYHARTTADRNEVFASTRGHLEHDEQDVLRVRIIDRHQFEQVVRRVSTQRGNTRYLAVTEDGKLVSWFDAWACPLRPGDTVVMHRVVVQDRITFRGLDQTLVSHLWTETPSATRTFTVR